MKVLNGPSHLHVEGVKVRQLDLFLQDQLPQLNQGYSKLWPLKLFELALETVRNDINIK